MNAILCQSFSNLIMYSWDFSQVSVFGLKIPSVRHATEKYFLVLYSIEHKNICSIKCAVGKWLYFIFLVSLYNSGTLQQLTFLKSFCSCNEVYNFKYTCNSMYFKIKLNNNFVLFYIKSAFFFLYTRNSFYILVFLILTFIQIWF